MSEVTAPEAPPSGKAVPQPRFWRRRLVSITALAALALLTYLFRGCLFRSGSDIRRMVNPPEQKLVLAVFPRTTVSKPMVDALGLSEGRKVVALSDLADLELVYELATPEATAQILRDRLRDPRVVLALGHESSTTALHLIPNVYSADSIHPIPLLLTAVTNPFVLGASNASEVHIMRIPASDEAQVKALGSLLDNLANQILANRTPSTKGAAQSEATAKVSLIVDDSNPTYSHFIAKELVALRGTARVVDSVGVGINSDGFSPDRLLSGEPDIVVFVGMEVPADIFLRRVKADGRKLWNQTTGRGLVLVFTDGAAGEVFERVRMTTLAEGESVFLSGPFSISRSAKRGSVLASFPDYAPYSMMAKEIAVALLREARNSGAVTRESVLWALRNRLATRNQVVEGAAFDRSGENIQGAEHVFRLTGNAIHHAEACPCNW